MAGYSAVTPTNETEHNLLTDNTLKKITQDVLARCSVIVSDHNVELARHSRNLVGQGPVTDCYFQHWIKNEGFVLLLLLLCSDLSKRIYDSSWQWDLDFPVPQCFSFSRGGRSGQNCISKSYQKKRGM